MALKILILGGTTEASALARALDGDARFAPVLSLAGRTKSPRLPPIPYRIGGFGGVAGLVDYLRREAVEALVDATHPFAAQMARHAAEAAERTGVPLLAIRRPEWREQAGDCWTEVPDMSAAAAALGSEPRRVFLTIGQKELAPFAGASQHVYLIRSVDAPDPAARPPQCEILTARGPFREEDEHKLLTEHRIEVLVTKNSGGEAAAAKLSAARALNLPVVMVARAPLPDAPSVETAEAALEWLNARHKAKAATRRGV